MSTALKKRILVATWDADRPRGTELRKLRPEFKDPQQWLTVIKITRPDLVEVVVKGKPTGKFAHPVDIHIVRATGPCSIRQTVADVEDCIAELCAGTPTVRGARMEIFAL